MTLGEETDLLSRLLVLQGVLDHLLDWPEPHFRSQAGDWDSCWVFRKVLSVWVWDISHRPSQQA